jgi:hypothetical protein
VRTSQFKFTYCCWICGHAVELETCKTDEHGMAVHEDCYMLKAALAKESMPIMVRKPARGVTALWYLLSGRGGRPEAK